jgi:hypothetical protein
MMVTMMPVPVPSGGDDGGDDDDADDDDDFDNGVERRGVAELLGVTSFDRGRNRGYASKSPKIVSEWTFLHG